MFDLEGKNLEAIKDSELWSDAKEMYNNMPLRERIETFSRLLYPHNRGELTLEQKLDILMKINPEEVLSDLLTEREITVINFLDEGLTYEDICIELGLLSKASIVQILGKIRNKIEEAL